VGQEAPQDQEAPQHLRSPFSPGGPATPGSPFGPSHPDAQMDNAIATAIPLMFITRLALLDAGLHGTSGRMSPAAGGRTALFNSYMPGPVFLVKVFRVPVPLTTDTFCTVLFRSPFKIFWAH
jgi:hypothetical protein